MRPSLFSELKRRNIYRVAVAYVVVAWLLIQICSILIVATLQAPPWIMRVVVSLAVLGFPVALILSWAFEKSPPGVTSGAEAAPGQASRQTGRKLIGLAVLLAALAAGLFIFQVIRQRPATSRVGSGRDTARPEVAEKSIAVLPFENLSEEKANAFFTEGVQDEILADLARIADLKVISRTSVMQYRGRLAQNVREIGDRLGVAHILEGSVQRANNHIRISAQLIDARSDAHLWAQTYDRDLVDVFAIQSEIAKTIAEQLQARLLPREKVEIEQPLTSNLAAHDLYSRASVLIADFSYNLAKLPQLKEATELLGQAVTLDPNFYEAYLRLDYVHETLFFLGWDHTPARRALAEAALQAAIRLRPNDGTSHLATAYHVYHDLNYDRARIELAEAEKTLPNNSQVFELFTYLNRRQGRWEDSIRYHQKALELDPMNSHLRSELPLTYEALRRYPEMKSAWERELQFFPADNKARLGIALADFYGRAEIEPLNRALEDILRQDEKAGPLFADYWLVASLCRRDMDASDRALAALPSSGMEMYSLSFPHALCAALVQRARGDEKRAREAFTAARAELEKQLQASPEYPNALALLGLCDAGLGHKEGAIQEGYRAMELEPVTRESLVGSAVIQVLSLIYAWTGDKDHALELLNTSAQMPGGVTYGELKLHPWWDPLRSDRRFAKVVAALAPAQR